MYEQFQRKVDEVNVHLKEICAEKDIAIITHSNINPNIHLNKSRLHLNDDCIFVLVRNFKAFLANVDGQYNSPFVIGDSVSPNDINRMKKQILDNGSNTIIGHLSINSFRNKFVFVRDKIKLMCSFPSNQFRPDRNRF